MRCIRCIRVCVVLALCDGREGDDIVVAASHHGPSVPVHQGYIRKGRA